MMVERESTSTDGSSSDSQDSEHHGKGDRIEVASGDGCEHYLRRAKLVCPDCNTVYWCRHCHDAEIDKELDPKKRHNLDRSRVTEIVCGVCDTRQPVGSFCSNAQCGITFGDYTCTKCPFYDDRVERQYYHCEDCGICRVGGRENFFHCNRCEGCFANSMKNNHTCVERNLKQNCPVCWEYQFDSVHPNTVLRCGHAIHVHCLQELEQNCTGIVPSCPICKKSIGDYSSFWEALDREIARHEVPEEYTGWKADITCNDCQKQTVEVPFNLIALKCGRCGSYNTSRQRVTMSSGEQVEGLDNEVGR